jgi:hypothetical protein
MTFTPVSQIMELEIANIEGNTVRVLLQDCYNTIFATNNVRTLAQDVVRHKNPSRVTMRTRPPQS